MAVLIDASNIIVSNIAVMWKNRKQDEYKQMLRENYKGDELKDGRTILKDSIRQMIIASIGKYVKKFAKGYGTIYICQDIRDKQYWRSLPEMGGFVHYKGNRKNTKPSDDPVPYKILMPIAHEIMDELSEVFPYRFVMCKYCEADDIIAVLAKKLSQIEEVLIVSEDKDLVQMQVFGNVKQYRPIKDLNHNFTVQEAKQQIAEMLLTGDAGDGIPNVRSPNNIFVDRDENGKQKMRSPSISAKIKKVLIENGGDHEAAIKECIKPAEQELALARLAENRLWILLDGTTPQQCVDEINEKSSIPARGSNAKIMAYLGGHKQCRKHAQNGENFMVAENNNPFASRKKSNAHEEILADDFWDDFA